MLIVFSVGVVLSVVLPLICNSCFDLLVALFFRLWFVGGLLLNILLVHTVLLG